MQKIDPITMEGHVSWVLTREDGTTISGEDDNLITLIGLRRYAEAGGGVPGVPAVATGMKLGTGTAAAALTGAGAALAAYLSNSHQAFAGVPAASTVSGKRRITYVVTWPGGQDAKATSASPITEAVIVNDALANTTSPEANTLARIVFGTAVPSKGPLDTLQVTWTHDIG